MDPWKIKVCPDRSKLKKSLISETVNNFFAVYDGVPNKPILAKLPSLDVFRCIIFEAAHESRKLLQSDFRKYHDCQHKMHPYVFKIKNYTPLLVLNVEDMTFVDCIKGDYGTTELPRWTICLKAYGRWSNNWKKEELQFDLLIF